VAVDSANSVYVTDQANCRVQKFDGLGNFKFAWGSPGSGPGQFGSGSPKLANYPAGVAVDSAGNVYVSDPYNNRVQKFDGSGNFKFAWGSPGSGNGQFNGPYGVAVDFEGRVYVADPGNNRVQEFYEIETTRPTFQPVQPRNMAIYVLGSDGNLWLETGPFGKQIPPPRLQVDGNVSAFQALDGNNVVVLGSDGNLWLETWPYGDVAQTIKNRKQVDANVAAFQAITSSYGNKVFVLGTDGNLWCEPWPTGDVTQTIKTRQQIDGTVKAFQALDVYDVFVLGADGNLWWEGLPFGDVAETIKNRRQVDAAVKTFQPIDGYNIFVLGTNNNLWLETWPVPGPNAPVYKAWGNVQETINNRRQVDANVAAFQAIDVNTVFVLGKDGNLWLETSPWGNVTPTTNTRQHVDANVGAFNVWVDEHNALGDWVVLVKDTDHILWHEQASASLGKPGHVCRSTAA
jgi:NHL repeat